MTRDEYEKAKTIVNEIELCEELLNLKRDDTIGNSVTENALKCYKSKLEGDLDVIGTKLPRGGF